MSEAIRKYKDQSPQLGDGVFVDPSSIVIGEVSIGKDSSIWPMAVIRGDVHRISIGERTSIQDGSILHVTHDSSYYEGGFPLSIGNDVTIGHKAILHGCTIGNLCLIGMGAIVLDGANVCENVVLGAGSIVPPGRTLESGFLWVGSPARKIRPLREEEMSFFKYSAANYVKLKNQHIDSLNRT